MGIFGNLFNKKKNSQNLESKTSNSQKKDNTDSINLGQNVYLLTKIATDPIVLLGEKQEDRLIQFKKAGDLRVLIGLDIGNQHHLLKQSDLKKFGLTEQELYEVALRNLTQKAVSELKVGQADYSSPDNGFKPFYQFQLDPNYLPSLFWIDTIWQQVAIEQFKLKGIIAAMPAKNILFFADVADIPGLTSLLNISPMMYEASIEDGIAFSQEFYLRKPDGQWEVFDPKNPDGDRLAEMFGLTMDDIPEDQRPK